MACAYMYSGEKMAGCSEAQHSSCDTKLDLQQQVKSLQEYAMDGKAKDMLYVFLYKAQKPCGHTTTVNYNLFPSIQMSLSSLLNVLC